MNKERLLYVVALMAVLGIVAAVYQFYFRAKLEKYGADRKLLDSLHDTHGSLKSTFGEADPDDIVTAWKGQVEVWNEAIAARAPFFTDESWREHEKPPEKELILQFWYADETAKLITELGRKAQEVYGNTVVQRTPDGFPYNFQSMMGVRYAEEFQGRVLSAEQVSTQLERLSYGISAFELLLDNKASQISYLKIKDIGSSGFVGKGINYSQIAVSFTMEMGDLAEFIEKMRSSNEYYSIQGMKLTHSQIAAQYDPLLQVDMYILRTRTPQEENKNVATGAEAAYGSNFGQQSVLAPKADAVDSEEQGGRRPRYGEQGRIGKAWTWFKRTVLYMN